MSKNLKPGLTLPDFERPDENGDLHRLSDLQGDNCLVLISAAASTARASACSSARW